MIFLKFKNDHLSMQTYCCAVHRNFERVNSMHGLLIILGLQSISRDVADNDRHPRRLDPTMELITYSFVLYLQHGGYDVKCKPSIGIFMNI